MKISLNGGALLLGRDMYTRKLSEAETYIMEAFWQKGALYSDDLAVYVADKAWKPTTLLTFLSRLVKKNMLAVEKHGKRNLYMPLVTLEQYQKQEGRAFLEQEFGGSLIHFLTALSVDGGLPEEDMEQLRWWMESR